MCKMKGGGGGVQNYDVLAMYVGFFSLHPHYLFICGVFNDAPGNLDDTDG
jgi:hypothetical protein